MSAPPQKKKIKTQKMLTQNYYQKPKMMALKSELQILNHLMLDVIKSIIVL